MDIYFENPFIFSINIIESDEKTPSIKMNIQVKINQFQNSFFYDGDFWIDCFVWTDFVKNLRKSSSGIAKIYDMSENFSFSIKNENNTKLLIFDVVKIDMDGNRQTKLNFMSFIDDDSFGKIYRQFSDFPIWWDIE